MSQAERPPDGINDNAHPNSSLVLFVLALLVYTVTRLVRLPDFPIYFFTDEAIQTQHATNLIQSGFRGPDGVLFPVYFENGGQFNLSLSVYAQVLPTLLFGKSVWVTRGVSALISLIAAISSGLILRNVFKIRCWWLGTLLLSAAPAWFLHSRTAFETVLMVSLYAGFLYCYLLYRQGCINALFPANLFGAASFYAYSPAQLIVPLTGVLLLIGDARYHWQHRRQVLLGAGLLVLLFLPFVHFSLSHAQQRLQHLILLNSYWVKPIPLYEKILLYLGRYLKGFNPIYWFWPNPSIIESTWPEINLPTWLFSYQHDLARHTMKGYGHLLMFTFPFFLVGLIRSIQRWKNPAYRTLLLASLAIPSGAAIVDWGITRGLAMIIPITLFTALGLDAVLHSISQNWRRIQYRHLSALMFILFAVLSLGMLADALTNGPTWYDDYGMSGMQYGAQQVFTRAAEIARSDPQTTVLVSSTWANGTDVLMDYFAGNTPNLKMGNINAFAMQYRPLDRNMLFVMTEEDLDFIDESGKFTNVRIEEKLPYPDGSDGFYFVRLEYVEDIQSILEAEHLARQALQSKVITLNGQKVQVQYPILDINEIVHIFDGDPNTLIRTLEANPLRLILTFPKPQQVTSITAMIGGTPTELTARAYTNGKEVGIATAEVEGATVTRQVKLSFNQARTIDTLEITIFNPHDGEIAHVHLWEIILE